MCQGWSVASPPRGRPPIIDDLIEEGIVGSVESYPKQTLNENANYFSTSPSKVKGILNDHKIQYFEQTAVVGLDEAHKNQRIQFFSQFNNI